MIPPHPEQGFHNLLIFFTIKVRLRFKIEDSGHSFDEDQLNLLTRDTIVQQEEFKNMVIQIK